MSEETWYSVGPCGVVLHATREEARGFAEIDFRRTTKPGTYGWGRLTPHATATKTPGETDGAHGLMPVEVREQVIANQLMRARIAARILMYWLRDIPDDRQPSPGVQSAISEVLGWDESLQ